MMQPSKMGGKTCLLVAKPDFVFYVVLLNTVLYSTQPLYPGSTWCTQPWCVYIVKHIKCWQGHQGGREEAVLYGMWWVTGSGRVVHN